MSTAATNLRDWWSEIPSLIRNLIVATAIFSITFVAYYLSVNEFFHRSPPNWYDHYDYLAKAILHGTLDVKSARLPEAERIPDYFQDAVAVGEAKYLPFPPAPAVLLLPFVAVLGMHVTFFGTNFTTEAFVSLLLGAANVVVFWYVLGQLKVSNTTKLIMAPFFAFGTVLFYSASTGTVWFFAHVAAVLFLLLAIASLLRGMNPLVTAFFLGCAFLSRQTTLLSAPFFLYWMLRQRHDTLSWKSLLDRETLWQMGLFGAGLVPFGVFALWYNAVRFDGIFDTGYKAVYDAYGGVPYSYYLTQAGSHGRFGLFDLRNIPLHLHVLFVLPPDFTYPNLSVFQPSKYGMSVLLTSPLFIYAFLVRRKSALVPASWAAIGLISIPIFLHYSQGWVQYGYRFLLDFAPFLLVLTALGVDDHGSPAGRGWQVSLLTVSVVAGFWGRYWANQLGW